MSARTERIMKEFDKLKIVNVFLLSNVNLKMEI